MFTVQHLTGFAGGLVVGCVAGYYVCHRGMSKAIADVKQAYADAKAKVDSPASTIKTS